MSGQYIKLDFVNTHGRQSQRSRELVTSAARSHATRVNFLKRTQTKRRKTQLVRESSDGGVESNIKIVASTKPHLAIVPSPSQQTSWSLNSETVPFALSYCINVTIPSLENVFDIFGVRMFWTDQWMRSVAQEPYHSAYAAHIQHIRDSSTDSHLEKPLSPLVMKYKLRAIQVLRQELATRPRVDDSSLLAMLQLGHIECRRGDVAQYDMHRAVIGKIIQDQRGVDMMKTPIAPLLAPYDLGRAMEAKIPILPAPKAYGPDASGGIAICSASTSIDQLPSGFRVLGKNGKLSLDVLRVLHRARETLDRNKMAPYHTPSSSESDPFARVEFNSDQPGTFPSFWSACPSLLEHPNPAQEEPNVNNLVALGIWLYVCFKFSKLSAFEIMQHWVSIARWMRHDLTTKLMKCVDQRSEDEEDCLKWLFQVAIESWKGPFGIPLHQGRVLHTFRLGRFLTAIEPHADFFETDQTLQRST